MLNEAGQKEFKNAFNEMAFTLHMNSKDKGFWNDVIHLENIVADDDQLYKYVTLLVFSNKLALMHSELSESLETMRKDPDKKDEHCPEFRNVEIELADCIIRIMEFAHREGYRLAEAIVAKAKFNEGRPFMHGKSI